MLVVHLIHSEEERKKEANKEREYIEKEIIHKLYTFLSAIRLHTCAPAHYWF